MEFFLGRVFVIVWILLTIAAKQTCKAVYIVTKQTMDHEAEVGLNFASVLLAPITLIVAIIILAIECYDKDT